MLNMQTLQQYQVKKVNIIHYNRSEAAGASGSPVGQDETKATRCPLCQHSVLSSINQLNQCFSYRNTVHRHSHVDVRGLEAALVNVVVGEGLGWVGAVLIHGDGDLPLGGYFASHGTSGWDMSRSQQCSLVPRIGSESQHTETPRCKTLFHNCMSMILCSLTKCLHPPPKTCIYSQIFALFCTILRCLEKLGDLNK